MDHRKSKRIPEKTSTSPSLTTLKPLTVWITTNCGKFLKRCEYQTTIAASCETYMQVKKPYLEPDMERWTGSKLGKEYIKAVYCHPAYLSSLQSTSCEILGWMKHKLKSRFQGEISITSDMQSIEELKSLLMKVKESEMACLKLNIQKTKIMGSGPITSWQTDRETVEIVIDFIFLGSKITADVDCSHEIKRHLLLERKATTNLDSILKQQRHYFANEDPYSQIYGFSSTHLWM